MNDAENTFAKFVPVVSAEQRQMIKQFKPQFELCPVAEQSIYRGCHAPADTPPKLRFGVGCFQERQQFLIARYHKMPACRQEDFLLLER